MKTILIIVCIAVALIAIWLVLSAVWMSKQSLVGVWVTSLPDGAHVTIQFEGVPKGGIYKQLTKRDGVALREFGHWTINLAALRLLMMASEIKRHPQLGVDTQYWVTWQSKSQITVDGPERSKWILNRATDTLRLDFDTPKPTD